MNELYVLLNAAHELGLELSDSEVVKANVLAQVNELSEKERHFLRLVASAEFADLLHEEHSF